jgi:hypothetical protein
VEVKSLVPRRKKEKAQMLDVAIRSPAIDHAQMRRDAMKFGVPASLRIFDAKLRESRPYVTDDPRFFRLDSDFRDLVDSVDIDRFESAGELSDQESKALRYMLQPDHNIGHIAAWLSGSGHRLETHYFAVSRLDIERFRRSTS